MDSPAQRIGIHGMEEYGIPTTIMNMTIIIKNLNQENA
jgi:hypothetical protein